MHTDSKHVVVRVRLGNGSPLMRAYTLLTVVGHFECSKASHSVTRSSCLFLFLHVKLICVTYGLITTLTFGFPTVLEAKMKSSKLICTEQISQRSTPSTASLHTHTRTPSDFMRFLSTAQHTFRRICCHAHTFSQAPG